MPAQEARETAGRLVAEGNSLEQAGALRQACERYREAARAAPGWARAHLNLGIGLEALGEADQAIASYRTALELDPGDPFAPYNLGKMMFARGSLAEAEPLLRRALEARPEFPEALVVLAGVLDARGDTAGAAAALEAALKHRPDYLGALHNYAHILKKLGRVRESESALWRAIAIDSESPEANYELANLLVARGARTDAERLLRVALRSKPDFLDARRVLFDICESLGDLAGAAAELEAILAQRPDWVDALYNYGCILRQQMRLGEAESALRRAIALDPSYARAYRMLGSVLLGQCRIDDALELYRLGRERCPGDFDLESAELFALNCSESAHDSEIYRRHAAFGARLEQANPARFEPFGNTRDPERRLRIGYVSGDFCFHVVSLFMIPLIERHDRSVCEVYCYSTGSRADEYTRRISSRADAWREAASLSETGLADLINRDRIDILVDLGGHSGATRLGVFAQQPAPVQATWLGYLNTTGLTRIHYRLSDRYCDPPGLTECFHTEALVRLPHSQWCYRPFVSTECAQAPPRTRNGFVTFGSFNQTVKISPTTRGLWAEILSRVPDSRLVVVGVQQGRASEDLMRDFGAAAIDPERIEAVPYLPLGDYFRRFNAVDIALDTTPYSGGTTSCDALWMGVPLLTLPGTRPSSRSAASVLSSVGLDDWIALTREDYVGKAVAYACDEGRLVELRRSLRQRMRRSPLLDEIGFAHDIEDAYRQMWRSWCGGACR